MFSHPVTQRSPTNFGHPGSLFSGMETDLKTVSGGPSLSGGGAIVTGALLPITWSASSAGRDEVSVVVRFSTRNVGPDLKDDWLRSGRPESKYL